MNAILRKQRISEDDIKLQCSTNTITYKWSKSKIMMEQQITDSKINLKGNLIFRERPKRADYILYLNAHNPIAVVEARDNNHNVSDGLQRAMTYAKMLDEFRQIISPETTKWQLKVGNGSYENSINRQLVC